MMNKQLINKAKDKFLTKILDNGEDPWDLVTHVHEAEKWATRVLTKYPKADVDAIMLSVWLHDIGYYPTPDEDHAIVSEREAKDFLKRENVSDALIKKVLHCVRSHRNKDVKPETLEARLFTMIDSISHFTYLPYIAMVQDGRAKQALEKLERDYRDISPFTEFKEEITPLYNSLKKFLSELEKTYSNFI